MKRLINPSLAIAAAFSFYTTADVLAHASSIPDAVEAPAPEPFTYRAALDPLRIHQLPDFMMHLRDRTDLVIQRSVFAPGVGGWHTHPGPSFAFVIQGHVKLQKFTEKDGCVETPVYGPGQAYIKPANELHRAIVVGEENDVELIVRFNVPEGGAVGILAADPGCQSPSEMLIPAATLSHQPPDAADTLENFIAQQVEPFTVRTTLDPFQIHQLPEFLMHSQVPTDLVIQRSVFAPGAGPWHFHPGPSFVYVISGEIKLRKFSEKEGCFETQVYGPGQAYFELGNQVHRALVVSEGSAVLMVARFLPAGAPITVQVPDPGCP
jgi:quercetin dioxygenase-like cupin family protein